MRLFELGAEYADLQARAEDGEDVGVALEQLSGALERRPRPSSACCATWSSMSKN